jgi:hypothetical protein
MYDGEGEHASRVHSNWNAALASHRDLDEVGSDSKAEARALACISSKAGECSAPSLSVSASQASGIFNTEKILVHGKLCHLISNSAPMHASEKMAWKLVFLSLFYGTLMNCYDVG